MESLTEEALDVVRLQDMARQIRRDTIRMIANASSGHPGGAMGAADIFAALYGHSMKHDPSRLQWPDRDRMVLSNGHICAAWYSALSLCGYLERDELATFRILGSRLQGHPAREKLPELVETSSGPLGQGVPVANGLALAKRMDGQGGRVYCIVGDGELHEGIVWEAAMTAAHYELSNVTLIVSDNGLQIDGEVSKIKNIEPIEEKFESFGWHAVRVDGHDISALAEAFESPSTDRPTAVVATTVMGKGAPFMENNALWHGKVPTAEEARRALEEIGIARGYEDFDIPGGDA